MSKTYTPGAEAAGLANLRAKIDAGDADYKQGDYTVYATAGELLADIKSTLGALLARSARSGLMSDEIANRPWKDRPPGEDIE